MIVAAELLLQKDEASIVTLLAEVGKIITPIVLILSLIAQVVKDRIDKRRAGAIKEAAEQVAKDLKVVDSSTKQELREIHTLVNSNMGMQLRIGSSALRRVADLTGREEDRIIADEAERLTKDHEQKQAKIDNDERRDKLARQEV